MILTANLLILQLIVSTAVENYLYRLEPAINGFFMITLKFKSRLFRTEKRVFLILKKLNF